MWEYHLSFRWMCISLTWLLEFYNIFDGNWYILHERKTFPKGKLITRIRLNLEAEESTFES